MKNQNTSEKQIKESKNEKLDSVNLESVKINVSKGNKELTNKEGIKTSNKDIYSIDRKSMSSEDQKKFRQKIRRDSQRFVKDILGKDRSDESRTKSISEFLEFYKKNWKIQDFRIENFSQSKNETDLKDYTDLLNYVKSTLE